MSLLRQREELDLSVTFRMKTLTSRISDKKTIYYRLGFLTTHTW